MVTAKDLARRRAPENAPNTLESVGPYDHALQRRWVGRDASLIELSVEKSDTAFDGESKDPD